MRCGIRILYYFWWLAPWFSRLGTVCSNTPFPIHLPTDLRGGVRLNRTLLIVFLGVAGAFHSSTLWAGPVSPATCCRAMVLTRESIVVLDDARTVHVRARSGGAWQPMSTFAERVLDLGFDKRLWLLTADGFVIALDDQFKVATRFEVGPGALSLGVTGDTIWVARPGPQRLVIDSYSGSGQLLGSNSWSVPLSVSESVAVRRMPVAQRMGFDLMHLAAGPDRCAAFYRFRNILLPCSGNQGPIRWSSSAAVQESELAAFEERSRLPARPRPHVFQAVGWKDGFAVIEWLTSFDPASGDYGRRDKVVLLDADGGVVARVPLGRQALAIAQYEGDLFVLLDDDGSRLDRLEVSGR